MSRHLGASRRTRRRSENLPYSVSLTVNRSLTGRLMTWNLQLYFPSEGKSSPPDFYRLKNPSPRPGLNPRTLGPVANTLTTTPPRRLCWRSVRSYAPSIERRDFIIATNGPRGEHTSLNTDAYRRDANRHRSHPHVRRCAAQECDLRGWNVTPPLHTEHPLLAPLGGTRAIPERTEYSHPGYFGSSYKLNGMWVFLMFYRSVMMADSLRI
jgi:hypothetical protein